MMKDVTPCYIAIFKEQIVLSKIIIKTVSFGRKKIKNKSKKF